jgi:small GTP-binding protein
MSEIPQLKIVFLGDSGVGKTCLLRRWSSDQFSSREPNTIAAGVESMEAEIGDSAYRLVLWDTAGQENYRSLAPSTVRGSQGVILVFDVTSEASFNAIPSWIDLMRSSAECGFVVVGNKVDLESERRVHFDRGDELAKSYGVSYYETSARTGQGVDDLFVHVCGVAATARIKKAAESVTTPSSVDVSGPAPAAGRKEKDQCC